MTQEEKELLLKDLSARLPYGVEVYYSETVPISTLKTINSEKGTCIVYDHSQWYRHSKFHIEEIKPYLRPLSSMTEEEKKEFCKIEGRMRFPCEYIKLTFSVDELDWLNAHHFDYRKSYDLDRKEWLSMIERGLAVEVTKENNPYDGSINTY